MNKFYLYLLLSLISFISCNFNNSSSKKMEEFDDKTGYVNLGEFTIQRTNNPKILKFYNDKGHIFFSTTMFIETSSVEITQNTNEGLIQDRYFMMNLKPNIIMFANNTNMFFIHTSVPLEEDVINNLARGGISDENIISTLLLNGTIIISKQKSIYKFNSVEIR